MRPDLLPSLGVALAGVFWGLFWLPIRALGGLGLEGAWAGAVIYAGCAVLLAPALVFRWPSIRHYWRSLVVSGLLTGTVFACYSTSILLTEIVRTILLFYLTPVWGTLLGIFFLGERLSLSRALALLLGIGGLLVVFGLGERLPWPRNAGDWLALASGMMWAWASLRLLQMGRLRGSSAVATLEQILAFAIGAFAVTLILIVLDSAITGGEALGRMPALSVLTGALPLGLLSAAYVAPMLFLTLWPATLLSPGRVGILLMGEVVVGVTSAASLAGEPFGLREILGTVLILSAGAVEVFGRRTHS